MNPTGSATRPKYFFEEIGKMKDLLKGKQFFLFLDFDGTLAPIADRPEDAQLPPKTWAVLNKLAGRPDCSLCIVSGRSLADIRHKVGIKKITYMGNHGFEIDGPGLHPKNYLFPKACRDCRAIEQILKNKFKNIPGVIFEDKGIILSIHYRLVAEEEKSVVKRTVQEVIKPYVQEKNITLREGKEVLELRPSWDWDKGKAVLWLLKDRKVPRGETAVIYIGDDATDEDAFAGLQDIAFTVRVGLCESSQAHYYLNSPQEVQDLLERILSLKEESS